MGPGMECEEKDDSRRSSVSENASWKLMASSSGWKRFSSLDLHAHVLITQVCCQGGGK